jgi:hypothetical protein
MFPEAEPEVCAAKVTVKEALSPAFRTSGKVIPLTENPLPLQSPEDMVTAEPLAASVTVRAVLLPTATLPKSRVGAETASEPGVVVIVPVPVWGGLLFCEVAPPPQPISAATMSNNNAREYRDIAIQLELSLQEVDLSRSHKYMIESTMGSVLS